MVKYSDKMTFCKNTVSDKRYYWNEVFEKNDKKEILKTLLDGFSGRDTKEYLLSIIENFNDKSDCRYYFIKDGAILAYLGTDLFIRLNDEYNSGILLLRKTKTSAYHAEYCTYALLKS